VFFKTENFKHCQTLLWHPLSIVTVKRHYFHKISGTSNNQKQPGSRKNLKIVKPQLRPPTSQAAPSQNSRSLILGFIKPRISFKFMRPWDYVEILWLCLHLNPKKSNGAASITQIIPVILPPNKKVNNSLNVSSVKRVSGGKWGGGRGWGLLRLTTCERKALF
jgi:hypothetical protein